MLRKVIINMLILYTWLWVLVTIRPAAAGFAFTHQIKSYGARGDAPAGDGNPKKTMIIDWTAPTPNRVSYSV